MECGWQTGQGRKVLAGCGTASCGFQALSKGGGAVLKAVGISDIGRCRKNNEDAYHITAGDDPVHNIYVVADGMGGCNAGEVASSSAIETFLEYLRQEKEHAGSEETLDLMTGAVAAANEAVYRKSNSAREFAEMGTTLVAAVIREEKLFVVHVGDSRAYLYRKKMLKPLTTDHSYVMELVKMGSITKEEAAEHPKRNVITRAVGIRDSVETDTMIRQVKKGDMLLLCTDGLSGMLRDDEIARILDKRCSVERKAAVLVDEANKHGGYDNISLILVEI